MAAPAPLVPRTCDHVVGHQQVGHERVGQIERIVELGTRRGALRRGTLLVLETVLVPMGLLLLGLTLGGPTAAFALVLGWRAGLPLLRLLLGVRVPMAVWLSSGLFALRVAPAWLAASMTVYLWQPIVISVVLGVFFLVSGLIGHPVTLRLAGDVVRLPEEFVTDPRVRRIFGEVAVIWGTVHVLCGAMGAVLMQLPTSTAVVAQGCLGVVNTVGSTVGAIGWGIYRLRQVPGLTIRFTPRTAPVSAVGEPPHLDAVRAVVGRVEPAPVALAELRPFAVEDGEPVGVARAAVRHHVLAEAALGLEAEAQRRTA